MLSSGLIARGLSRLLSYDAAAKDRLRPYAGSTLQMRMPPLAVTLCITPEGDFTASEAEGAPTVTVEFPLTALPLLAQGQDAALRAARIEGRAGLLRDVAAAMSNLPLAAEAELERFVGPILAHELMRLVAAFQALADSGRRSIEEAGARYLRDEAGIVVRREEVSQFAADLQRLRIEVEELSNRVKALARA